MPDESTAGEEMLGWCLEHDILDRETIAGETAVAFTDFGEMLLHFMVWLQIQMAVEGLPRHEIIIRAMGRWN